MSDRLCASAVHRFALGVSQGRFYCRSATRLTARYRAWATMGNGVAAQPVRGERP